MFCFCIFIYYCPQSGERFRISTSYLHMIFVSRYGCQNLIPMFFLVQKICFTPIEMVCSRTVLAIWENDKGPAPWALPVEYGYYWCTWSDGMWSQVPTWHAFWSIEFFWLFSITHVGMTFLCSLYIVVEDWKLFHFSQTYHFARSYIGRSRTYFFYYYFLQANWNYFIGCWI